MTYAINVALLCRDHRRAEEWRRQLEADSKHQIVALGQWASEAAALIKHADPDVLVSELELSDGPATELVRGLRQGNSGMGLMILMVTPAPDDPVLLECLRLGADSYYIEGPGPTLASRVAEMLSGEAKMSPAIARQVLDHFCRPGGQKLMSTRPMDEAQNPLLLSQHERSVLLRLAQGQSVPQIATAERLTMHEVAKCIRGLYRKMSWDLRTSGLALELL